MSGETRELIELCEQLPEAKRVEVADFARFLLAQQSAAGVDGDERWEQIVAEPKPLPKRDEFLRGSRAEVM